MRPATTTIRLARREDAGTIREIYRPFVEETSISFETELPGVEAIEARIEAVLEGFPWLVAESGGHLLGYAYATRHRERAAYRWGADVSVYVRPGHQRQGLARRLYRPLLACLERQGYVRALAGITLPNPPSVAFHEAMGFVPVGVYRSIGYKLGRWHDVGWWQRPLRDRPDPPAEPRPPGALGAFPWEEEEPGGEGSS